jgi:hypothetical protein
LAHRDRHLLQSHIDEAIVWLEKARSENPARPWTHTWLASAYALKGDTQSAAAELAEARRLRDKDSYSSIVKEKGGQYWRGASPKTRALWEATYIAGLRKAGVPEE